MMSHERKRPVTIEDLLRVKRAEHPSEEFWTEFDRELRAKQLAALVAKRPWWRSLPEGFRNLARFHLPIGATAVLAITFVSIRGFHPGAASSHTEVTANAEIAHPTLAELNADDSADESRAPVRVATTNVDSAATATPTAFRSDATVPGELSRMVPLLSGHDSEAVATMRPSARSIAQNLAVAETILGTSSPSFETRAIPTRQTPREPLADITNPSESRRSRFAAAFASMSTDPSIAPSARVARRLSDEQLYDSIHRFGASGNSVSFKF
jgi:hypothetical protein